VDITLSLILDFIHDFLSSGARLAFLGFDFPSLRVDTSNAFVNGWVQVFFSFCDGASACMGGADLPLSGVGSIDHCQFPLVAIALVCGETES
jgi:hypothetical protein